MTIYYQHRQFEIGNVSIFHSVEFEGFIFPEIWETRDQICPIQGPKVKLVMQVDF